MKNLYCHNCERNVDLDTKNFDFHLMGENHQGQDDRQQEEISEVDAYYLKEIEKSKFVFEQIKNK